MKPIGFAGLVLVLLTATQATAGEAPAGEFAPRGGQKLLLRRFRVTPPRDWAV
jgi:hypothetical protein